jgi:hypothetical protein
VDAQVAEGWRMQYAIFACAGFNPALQAEVAQMGAMLVLLSDLEQTLVVVESQLGLD